MHLNGFSAWISIENKDATEYAVEVDEARATATCWIASEVGKTFAILWKNVSYDEEDVSARVKIDGSICSRKVHRLSLGNRTLVSKGVEKGVIMEPFMFSTLSTTDDDESLMAPPTTLSDNPRSNKYSLPDIVVHERAKKAINQRVSLGQPVPIVKRKIYDTTKLGPPVAIFRFKYRPLDILQASGIAPRPAEKRKASDEPDSAPSSKRKSASATASSGTARSTSPITIDDSDEEDVDQELASLKARVAALEGKKARKSLNGKVKEEEFAGKIKCEDGEGSAKTARDTKPTFIDLTLD
ncbi:hypothetical protein HMN09_00737000 [Mycena chlorophos]|uniref:DUF7918 domain-containing protein n=1 Tax=Mycena chlorophos TaxID=658473 RepID=A0A8H6SXP8_MYCCL|nr:hypothetical protein HMN09_00737000 [Mycena chlorophos]